VSPAPRMQQIGRVGKRPWYLDPGLVAVLLIGLVLRLAFARIAPVFLEGDSQSYLVPAWDLASGQGFSPELRRTPIYPLLVTASFTLFGQDLQPLAIVQHALGLTTVGLVYLLARYNYGRFAGLLAGLAIAVSGPQLIYERYVMTEAVFGLALVAVGVSALAALRPWIGGTVALSRSRYALMLVSGLAIGLAALTRPVAQAILPLFLLAILLSLPRWRTALKAAGLVLAGYALITVPWSVRNLAAHDSLTASGGLGRSLIARTVKYDTLFDWKWLSETYGSRDDLAARERMLLYRKRGNIPSGRSVRPYQDALTEELGLSQGQAEAAMREVALEAIARRPLEYVIGSLRFTGQLLLGEEERLQSHWKQRANKDWAEQWDDRLDHLVVPLTPNQVEDQPFAAALTEIYQPARIGWPLMAFFVFGCLVAVRETRRRPALLLAGAAVILLALSAFLDGPVSRYRLPVEPLISVIAAGGLATAAQIVLGLFRRPRVKATQPLSQSPLPLRES
jgi:4-amino-4-deoxy-L-arabinose transferase-like glycosyltransferase